MWPVLAVAGAGIALFGPVRPTIVAGSSMEPTLSAGDLVLTRPQDDYRVGDIILYRVPSGDPGAGGKVIHRIIDGSSQSGFVTRGDNTPSDDYWNPTHRDVIGLAWRVIPVGGMIMLWIRSPILLAILTGVLVMPLMLKLLDNEEQTGETVGRHRGRRARAG